MSIEKLAKAAANVWLGIGAFIAFTVLVIPVGLVLAFYNLGKSLMGEEEKNDGQ